MRVLYNPFRKRKKKNGLWTKLQLLSNFTWSNKKAIEAMQLRIEQQSFQINEMQLSMEQQVPQINEMQLNQDFHAEQISDIGDWKREMLKPKKRGRPRKRV